MLKNNMVCLPGRNRIIIDFINKSISDTGTLQLDGSRAPRTPKLDLLHYTNGMPMHYVVLGEDCNVNSALFKRHSCMA